MTSFSDLKALLEAAPPLPWYSIHAGGIPVGLIVNDEWDATEDAALIVAAVNALPRLIAVAETVERVLAQDLIGETVYVSAAAYEALDAALAALDVQEQEG